jgi:MFS family permease
MRPELGGLWRHRDFMKLWSAQATSVFGSQLASLAYPLTAILVLQATTFQMGMLQAAGGAAAVIVGLFAGVIVDRVRRKPLLIATDLGRAALALFITIAAFSGFLTIHQLYVVYFLSGALSIIADVSGMAFLPSLLGKEELVEGNSKFGTTESAALIAGPSLSGALLQILTAPFAILIDALSFLVSAVFVSQIRVTESHINGYPPDSTGDSDKKQSIWSQIGEGLRFVYGHPLLRPLAESIALYFLFRQIVLALFALYAIRVLNLEPFWLGVIFSALGFGFLFGALSVRRITNRFGVGRTMIGANLINIFAIALVPAAGGSTVFVITLLVISHFLHAFGVQINGINLVSLRQKITPNHLQGRMTASFRFVGMMMFGSLIAGALGEWIGLRETLVAGAIGMLLPFLRLLFSPLRNFKEDLIENNR